MKPLAQFRVYAKGRSGLYAGVTVWPTREAMRAYSCPAYAIPHRRRLLGCCATMLEYRKGRRTPWFAEIHLALRDVGSRVLVHELFHATLAWGRRKGIDFGELTDPANNEAEERLAEVHDWMMGQACAQLRRLKLVT